jgi:ubiquinone/menaquinone biosynthesis C-methylase UbiE
VGAVTREQTILEQERNRVQAEYARRRREIPADRYAPWDPAEMFMRTNRRRSAARLLRACGVFPSAGARCLEVGVGELGWLPALVDWGVRAKDLSGIDLDTPHIEAAREAVPSADLRVGDATALPWDDGTFDLVIASTLFTSILDTRVRKQVASEIARVLRVGGALLWYDFAFDNPRNANVKKVERRELIELFPTLGGRIERITLAPPITRFIAPRSWTIATLLETLPWLRTHLIGVLVKMR